MSLFPSNMDGILLLGQTSYIQDIKFKIYWLSKSIQAAKSQSSGSISEVQKLTWAKFLKTDFFLFEKTRLCRYYENKNQLVVTSSSYISLMMKLLVASYLIAQRQSKSEILLFGGKQYLTFASDNSSSFQASWCFKK